MLSTTEAELREVACLDSLKLYWNTGSKPPFIFPKLQGIVDTVQTLPSLHSHDIPDTRGGRTVICWLSIAELCLTAGREKILKTAVIIGTEPHLVREKGQAYMATYSLMVVSMRSTWQERKKRRRVTSCLDFGINSG